MDQQAEYKLEDAIKQEISNLEKEYNLKLSESAVSMLILPIVEMKDQKLKDFDQWKGSLKKIFEEMKMNPASVDKNTWEDDVFMSGDRTTQSVIKAIAILFCNIPPICTDRSVAQD